MLSLSERISLLEKDLTSTPLRISVYNDLPFAILRYDPDEEWQLRREARLLATRLESQGKTVHLLSMADLLWQAVAETEGADTIIEMEQEWGFAAAQEQVTTYLSDPDWRPLPDLLSERLAGFDPAKDMVFLMRAAAMAPALYQMSKLLDEMHGRTLVPTILFYPGTLEGTTGLRFMALKEREALGNYRVKIYS
jgi:hypothetical protein